MIFFYLGAFLLILGIDAAHQNHFVDKNDESHASKQLKIYKLFNNLGCLRKEDDDLQEVSREFNPLDNLHLYKNPQDVKDYLSRMEQGELQDRFGPFTNDPVNINQMIDLFDILYFIPPEDFSLFYKTAAYFALRSNTAHVIWALGTILSTKYYGQFKSPRLIEITPQFFADKRVIQDANGLIHEKWNLSEKNPATEEEEKLEYYRLDPELNAYHQAWHVDNPFWWNPEKYSEIKGRKGELFLYMHHQIVNRYKAERISVGLPELEPLVVDKSVPIPAGDVPNILNINFRPFPRRFPNYHMDDQTTLTISQEQQYIRRINEGIENGYFLKGQQLQHISNRGENGTNILGTVVESSAESVDAKFYGSVHNSLHRILRTIGSLPGVQAHSETSMRDSVFYRLHLFIDGFLNAQKSFLGPYTKKDFGFSGVHLRNLQLSFIGSVVNNTPIITTHFENFSWDYSNAVLKDCEAVNNGKNFTTTARVLAHKSFRYEIQVTSDRARRGPAAVRIFMSPIFNSEGIPYEEKELHRNMIELDKFPVVIKPGVNTIRRWSNESSLTVPPLQDFQTLFAELSNGSNTYPSSGPYRHCGYPNRLLIPKGKKEGMKFRMFAIISPEEGNVWEEKAYPAVSFCGNPVGQYPDKRAMGFPFDREVNLNEDSTMQNWMFRDIIVQHNV